MQKNCQTEDDRIDLHACTHCRRLETSATTERRYDGYGIYVGRLCDECAAKDSRMQFGRTRQFDPDYAGESLEPEDY